MSETKTPPAKTSPTPEPDVITWEGPALWNAKNSETFFNAVAKGASDLRTKPEWYYSSTDAEKKEETAMLDDMIKVLQSDKSTFGDKIKASSIISFKEARKEEIEQKTAKRKRRTILIVVGVIGATLIGAIAIGAIVRRRRRSAAGEE